MKQNKILIIAGEASGEAHAARVITALKLQDPSIIVQGIGGEKMQDAGAEILVDFSELAVMGLVEVLKRYGELKAIFNKMVDVLKDDRPDLLVLVDYPGFNLKLAKEAKKLGIPVLYYISPKVWAWRAGRVKTIKKVVDMMAVLFPFEEPIYQQAGVRVDCVGHPLVDAVKRSLTKEQAKLKLGIDPQQQVLGLFPGSRRSEVQVLLPIMIKAAERLHTQNPQLEIVVPLAQGLEHDLFADIAAQSHLPIKLEQGDFYELTSACDAIVAASGTVTLEIALLAVPHFICYRVSPLTYKIMSRLVRIPYVGLCNIVTDEVLIDEVLQNKVTEQHLADKLTVLLESENSQQQAEIIREKVLTALGPAGGANNAATLIIKQLNSND